MEKRVQECLKPDGGLFSLRWYLCWELGDEKACLDGNFSAEQLRAIADVMDGKNANDQPQL